MNDPMPAIRSILGMPETEVEPVDHKAEAEEVLAYRGSLDAAVALAHATLYLAEQQRIANLLALAQFDHKTESGTRLYTNLKMSVDLRNEAAEALGVQP